MNKYNKLTVYGYILINLFFHFGNKVDKSKFNKKFGLFVAKKRINLGLTQSDLASMLGNNAQNISRLERGEVSPTLFWLKNLSEAFDISLTQLVEEFESSI